MGFGLIFIGYLFTVFDMGFLVNNTLSVIVTELLCTVGYTVLIVGVTKLSQYAPRARKSQYCLVALTLVSIANMIIQALWYFGNITDEAMKSIRMWIFPLIAVLYAATFILLLLSVRDIAKETECAKVIKKTKLSLSLTVPFCVLNLAAALPVADLADIIAAPRYICFVIITIINAVTLYSAYMWICLDTDLEMEGRKKTGKQKDSE